MHIAIAGNIGSGKVHSLHCLQNIFNGNLISKM